MLSLGSESLASASPVDLTDVATNLGRTVVRVWHFPGRARGECVPYRLAPLILVWAVTEQRGGFGGACAVSGNQVLLGWGGDLVSPATNSVGASGLLRMVLGASAARNRFSGLEGGDPPRDPPGRLH